MVDPRRFIARVTKTKKYYENFNGSIKFVYDVDELRRYFTIHAALYVLISHLSGEYISYDHFFNRVCKGILLLDSETARMHFYLITQEKGDVSFKVTEEETARRIQFNEDGGRLTVKNRFEWVNNLGYDELLYFQSKGNASDKTLLTKFQIWFYKHQKKQDWDDCIAKILARDYEYIQEEREFLNENISSWLEFKKKLKGGGE